MIDSTKPVSRSLLESAGFGAGACCGDHDGRGIASPAPLQRLRLWELSSGWHCTIVGTCLGLDEDTQSHQSEDRLNAWLGQLP